MQGRTAGTGSARERGQVWLAEPSLFNRAVFAKTLHASLAQKSTPLPLHLTASVSCVLTYSILIEHSFSLYSTSTPCQLLEYCFVVELDLL